MFPHRGGLHFLLSFLCSSFSIYTAVISKAPREAMARTAQALACLSTVHISFVNYIWVIGGINYESEDLLPSE